MRITLYLGGLHGTGAMITEFDYIGRNIPGLDKILLGISKNLSSKIYQRHLNLLLQKKKVFTQVDAYRNILTRPVVLILDANVAGKTIKFELQHNPNQWGECTISAWNTKLFLLNNVKDTIKELVPGFCKLVKYSYSFNIVESSNIRIAPTNRVVDAVHRSMEECKQNRLMMMQDVSRLTK